MKINDIITENNPHGTDDVDWSKVESAVKSAAKKIHGKVDKSKVSGIMTNLRKHKPNDTENAIQTGTDMLRAKNESVIKESTEVAELGRAMMDIAIKQKDDEVSNNMSTLGDTLTRFGTRLGPKNIKDVVKQTGLQPDTIQQYMQLAQKYVEKHGPVRTGADHSAPDDMDDKDDY